MRITIKDNIPDDLALELVLSVIKGGRVSKGKNGKMCYCFVALFGVKGEEYVVKTSSDSKDDCFLVYKIKLFD